MNTEFNTLYLTKLKKAWDVEDQLIRALPKMAELATSKELYDGLLEHLEQTKGHREKVGEVLAMHEESRSGTPNPAFEQLLTEAENAATEEADLNVRDALIIAEARTIEHIEMSMYLTLIDWANELNDTDATEVFEEILDEEQTAEQKLATVATGGLLGLMGENVNEKAAAVM